MQQSYVASLRVYDAHIVDMLLNAMVDLTNNTNAYYFMLETAW